MEADLASCPMAAAQAEGTQGLIGEKLRTTAEGNPPVTTTEGTRPCPTCKIGGIGRLVTPTGTRTLVLSNTGLSTFETLTIAPSGQVILPRAVNFGAPRVLTAGQASTCDLAAMMMIVSHTAAPHKTIEGMSAGTVTTTTTTSGQGRVATGEVPALITVSHAIE